MHYLTKNLVVILLLSGFGFSGCEVFDNINKYILQIEEEDSTSSDSNTTTCNDGYTYDSTNGICVENTTTSEDNESCETQGLYFETDTCVSSCSTGYTLDATLNTCVEDDTTTLEDNESCETQGLYFETDSCVSSCSTGYTLDSTLNTCVEDDTTTSEDNESCETQSLYFQVDTCVSSCSTGYTLDATLNTCVVDDTTTSEDNESCETQGLYFQTDTCVSSCSTGYTLDSTLNTCVADDTTEQTCEEQGLYIEGDNCVANCSSGFTLNSSTNTCLADVDSEIDSFNLFFSSNSAKYLEHNLTFNEEINISVEVDPLQPAKLLEEFVEDSSLFTEIYSVQNADYTYTLTVVAGETSGESNITIVLDNGVYSTDIDLLISIFEQIKISTTRIEYNTLLNEETIIPVTAINIKNNPLKIAITSIKQVVDSGETQSTVEDEDNLQVSIDGSVTITSDTSSGVEFDVKIKGILAGTYILGFSVTDTTNSKSESKNLIINVVTKNTEFIRDLYECGFTYTELQTQQIYNVISDDNTDDTSTVGEGIELLSTYTMTSDLSDSYSTIMIFYPKSSTNYSSTMGVAYFYPDDEQYAVISYSASLAGKEYYVKYYDEAQKDIICVKEQFPSTTTDVTDSVAIDEEDDIDNPDL